MREGRRAAHANKGERRKILQSIDFACHPARGPPAAGSRAGLNRRGIPTLWPFNSPCENGLSPRSPHPPSAAHPFKILLCIKPSIRDRPAPQEARVPAADISAWFSHCLLFWVAIWR